jgi:hypothetical protein
MGLRLSPEKTLITHIDDGLDFLGWRIQRHRKRGTGKTYVYVYPAKKTLAAIMVKVKAFCRQSTTCRSTSCSSISTGCCGAGPRTSSELGPSEWCIDRPVDGRGVEV